MNAHRILLLILMAALTVTTGCDLTSGEDDRRLGEVVWSHPLAYPDDITITQPAIDGEVAFVAASRALICFALADGAVKWKTDLGTSYAPTARRIIVEGDRIYLNHREWRAPGSWVAAFDKRTGKQMWRTYLNDFVAIDRAALAEHRDHMFLGGRGEVVRLRKDNGMLDLRIPVIQLRPEGVRQSAYDPVVSEDGILYVPTAYFVEGARATSGNLPAYDALTEAFLWGSASPSFTIPVPEFNPRS